MEMLDVLDEQGNPIGVAKSRKEVHEKGLWHKCAHTWILNSKEEFLLQKRSAQKETSPGKWDISAAGHVSAGQTSVEAAQREISEELGLDVKESEMVLIGTIKAKTVHKNGVYINNQFNDVYLVRKDFDPTKIVLQKEEVEEIKFISFAELQERVGAKDLSLVSHDEEYELLFKLLK